MTSCPEALKTAAAATAAAGAAARASLARSSPVRGCGERLWGTEGQMTTRPLMTCPQHRPQPVMRDRGVQGEACRAGALLTLSAAYIVVVVCSVSVMLLAARPLSQVSSPSLPLFQTVRRVMSVSCLDSPRAPPFCSCAARCAALLTAAAAACLPARARCALTGGTPTAAP